MANHSFYLYLMFTRCFAIQVELNTALVRYSDPHRVIHFSVKLSNSDISSLKSFYKTLTISWLKVSALKAVTTNALI